MCKYSIRTCTYKCFEIKRLIIPSIRDKYMDIVNVYVLELIQISVISLKNYAICYDLKKRNVYF